MESGRIVDEYAKLWTRLNAVNGLIDELERERAEIKVKQRQLANSLIRQHIEETS